MWICLKCNNYNSDEMETCLRCESLRGDLAASKSHPVRKASPEPGLFDNLPKPVGMTRRFSVGTMMIIMTFYAILFSVMKMLGAGPSIFAGVTVFITGIGAGQMFAPAHISPRKVSFISGIVMGIVSSIVATIVASMLYGDNNSRDDFTGAFCGIFSIFGGPLGYLAGGLIAGIFLFREREEQKARETEEMKSEQ